MTQTTPQTDTPKRRGRPRIHPDQSEARNRLLRSGLAHLTEKGYSAVGIDEILRDAQVPKGGFYHYFQNKAAFGLALIAAYHDYFAALIDAALLDESRAPLDRLRHFIEQAEAGMARHQFRRGCLIGNLGQEMSALPDAFREQLIAVLADWQRRTANCFRCALEDGSLPAHHDPEALAAFFWTGWEGAVLRAKLELGPAPLRQFTEQFFRHLKA